MKLEIRHLAPYLAHKVKVSKTHFLSTGNGIGSIDHILTTKNDVYKLILHPLSEVMDINSPLFNRINTDLKIQMEICDLANKQIGYWDLSYSAFDVMCENHIDVFGLIDEGLATDINTLKD